MRTLPSGLLVLGLLGLLFVGACSSPPTLRMQSLSQAPAIDGALSEWGGTLRRVGDQSVSMSAVPTDSLLYLAIVIPDQALIRSVAERGLVVWVDPTGKQRHTYGVQYPLALQRQRAAQKTSGASGSESSDEASTLDELFPSDLALIRNDTIRRRMPARFSSALQAHATLNTGALIYEIAIPVNQTTADPTTPSWKHGLRTPLNRTMSIGLQIPDSGDESQLQGGAEGIPSVTGRGQGGRSPRGRRGRGGQRGRQAPPPDPSPERATLDLWTRVVADRQ